MEQNFGSSLEIIREDYFSNWSLYLTRLMQEATYKDSFATMRLYYQGDRTFILPLNAETMVNIIHKYWDKVPAGVSTLDAMVNVGSHRLGLLWTEEVLTTRRGGFLRTYNLPKDELTREIWLVKYLPLLEEKNNG